MATQPIGPVKTLRMSRDPAAAPIIESPKLKAMKGTQAVSRRIGGKVLTMAASAEPVTGDLLMKPVPSKPAEAGDPPRREQAGAVAEAAQDDGSNSVRLRLRITRGQVSVIDVHAVPGVAPAPERLDYGLVYEVRNGNRRVAIGSVPDVGMRRSYPDPQGRPGQEGHHLQELESIEVNLRLPQREFSAAALPKLNVQLFRMKSQPATLAVASVPLAEQFPDVLRPVAELRGIDVKQLSQRLQGAVRDTVFEAPTKVRRRQ